VEGRKFVKIIAWSLGLSVWSVFLGGGRPIFWAGSTTPPPIHYPQWPWSEHGFARVSPRFVSIPFSQKFIKDSNLPKGQTLLITPGRPGIAYCVGPVRTIIAEPVDQVVATGTALVHVMQVDGAQYSYDRVLTVLTTAYNGQYSMNGPAGAVAAWDGLPLHDGDVAVDPAVIPLGAYLYVDGYGPARAVDTGSAIAGDHIDLFFQESASKISRYGMQFHKVYVLTFRPTTYHG
jgi:3D (Asp-Asp-Asp) domain-containing protein